MATINAVSKNAVTVPPKKVFTSIKLFTKDVLRFFSETDMHNISVSNLAPYWLKDFAGSKVGSPQCFITYLVCYDLSIGHSPKLANTFGYSYRTLTDWFTAVASRRAHADNAVRNMNSEQKQFIDSTDFFNRVLFEYYKDIYIQLKQYVEMRVNEINYVSEDELP